MPRRTCLICALALVLLSVRSWGSPPHDWSRRFGDGGPQSGASVATDASGNVFLAGQFEGTINLGGGVLSSPGGADIFLAKFDNAGNHLWSHAFTDPNYDNTPSIVIDAAGSVVMSGNFTTSIDFGGGPLSAPGAENVNIFVVRFDAAGNHLWSRTFAGTGAEFNYSLALDGSGNIVLTGPFGGSVDFGGGPLASLSVYDMYLAKLDPDGNHIWSHAYGGQTGLELSTEVAVDDTDHILVSGRFNGSVNFGGGLLTTAGADDIYLAKFSPGGSHVWSRRFGDQNVQIVGGLAVDDEENVFLAGHYLGSVDFGGGALNSAGGYDAFLAKFESDGDHTWSHRFGDAATQAAHAIAIDAAGNAIMTGMFLGTVDFGDGALTAAGSSFSDIFLTAFDSDGNHAWSERYGDSSLDFAATVALDPTNHVVLSGRHQGTINFGGDPLTSAGDDDVFLVRFAPVPTAIAGERGPGFELRAYPNPFNPLTTFVYQTPRPGFVQLRVYDVNGTLVRTLRNTTESAGLHRVRWDGRNDHGAASSSGVYFARLTHERSITTHKIVLLK